MSSPLHEITAALLALVIVAATAAGHLMHADTTFLDYAALVVLGFYFGRATGSLGGGGSDSPAPPPPGRLPPSGAPPRVVLPDETPVHAGDGPTAEVKP